MRQFTIITIAFILLVVRVSAQSNEEILKDLKDLESSSTLKIGAGFGNKILSAHNNSLNSQQSNSTFIFTPSASYFHKSGLSLSTTAYGLQNNGSFSFSQFAINPAFDYTKGKDVTFSLSYTHYYVTNEYNTRVTPVKNDFFAEITGKNGWVKPGLQLGYATGDFKNVTNVDTTFRVGGIPTHYKFIDTSSIKTSPFSFTGTLEHTFYSGNVLTKDDGFTFVPQLLINFGSGKDQILQSTSGNYGLILNKRRLTKRKFNNKNQTTSKSPFALESIGIDLNGDYVIGNFSIQPNLYLDYFVASTLSKRFNQVYSINFSYNF